MSLYEVGLVFEKLGEFLRGWVNFKRLCESERLGESVRGWLGWLGGFGESVRGWVSL